MLYLTQLEQIALFEFRMISSNFLFQTNPSPANAELSIEKSKKNLNTLSQVWIEVLLKSNICKL